MEVEGGGYVDAQLLLATLDLTDNGACSVCVESLVLVSVCDSSLKR